jgi:hypothetical protein
MRRLGDALKNGNTVSESARMEELAAENALDNFILRSILRELKQHPEGVLTDSFGDQADKSVYLAHVEKVVERVMAESDVIYYDFKYGSYKLGSYVLKKFWKRWHLTIVAVHLFVRCFRLLSSDSLVV